MSTSAPPVPPFLSAPRALEAGWEPHLGHHVVVRIVAPPRAMMLRLGRQLHAGDLLDFAEGERHFLRALLTQKFAERFVFAHAHSLYTVCHRCDGWSN